jgi:hypothetical protein
MAVWAAAPGKERRVVFLWSMVKKELMGVGSFFLQEKLLKISFCSVQFSHTHHQHANKPTTT